MVVRLVHSAGSDVSHNFLENSIPNNFEARTMSHAGVAGTVVPLSLIGLIFMFFSPGMVGGQSLIPGGQPDPASTLKEYTGFRVNNDSLRQVYYHDQAIIVVELGPGKQLLNCEIIEVYTNAKLALEKYNYSAISKPIMITFSEIADLMQKCQSLPRPVDVPLSIISPSNPVTAAVELLTGTATARRDIGQQGNSMSIFRGIMPGTKWCGPGDIAKSYFDLGSSDNIDKCCRSHDLCPAKVRSLNSRYNLTNYSLYTKSHCYCDNALYNCLKATNDPRANVVGNIYFNVVRVPCVQEVGCPVATPCDGQKKFGIAQKHY